jgi:hypothetical protein
MPARACLIRLLTVGLMSLGAASMAVAAPVDCKGEEAALAKDESDLPRLEVASPADRPITCITLETIIAFATRLKAHVAHCPASTYSASAMDWEATRVDYVKRFADNRCKRTF